MLQLRLDVMPPELRFEFAHQGGHVGEAPTPCLASTSAPGAAQAARSCAMPGALVSASVPPPAAAAAAGTSGMGATGGSGTAGCAAAPAGQGGARSMKEEVDASYFDSYSGFNIHREMISDKVRVCVKCGCEDAGVCGCLHPGVRQLSFVVLRDCRTNV